MEIIRISHSQIPTCPPSSCCIGYFDGIHKGHQALLNNAKKMAKKSNIKSSLITFDPDPWLLFHPQEKIQHISTLKDKIYLAQSMGIELFYIIEFTQDLATLSVDQFHALLEQMNIQSLTCGFDFKYANQNSGNTQSLTKQNSFDVHVIESINDLNQKISSSRIKPCIEQGHIQKANALLGYAFSIKGKIVKGYQRGSTLLKIPTANLDYDNEYILPKMGVYAGMVLVNENLYPAMMNIGNNPTFDNLEVTIEAHILDFNQDIYHKEARFFFLEQTREEIKFDHFEDLKQQLQKDVKQTTDIIKKNSVWIRQTKEIWLKNTFKEI